MTDPRGLRFREIHRQRPRALLSPFVAHDLRNVPPSPPGELVELGPGPSAPYCAVVVDLERADGDGGVRFGLAGGRTAVLARYDAGGRTLALEVHGERERLELPVPGAPPAPCGLALVVGAEHATVLARRPGGDWRPLATEAGRVRRVADLRDPRVLRGLRYVHGVTGGGPVRLARVRAGYSGRAGVRDPQVVRRPDGSPLVRDGRLFLTMTDAGFGHFARARWGVWTLDLADPGGLEEVGAIFFARDGLVLGDHAGQLVVDEDADRAHLVVSSWGNFEPATGVHLRAATATADVLHGVSVLESRPLRLPTPHSAWDPSLAPVDGRWHLAFVECVSFGPPRFVFSPALAVAEGDDPLGRYRRVAADERRQQTEGTILHRFGDRWVLLASDRDAAEYPVYDLGLHRRGRLRAPYGTNIPHPMVVRAGDEPDAPWWLVTFDGTPWHEDVLGYGTHGDFVVLAAGAGRPDGRALSDASWWDRAAALGRRLLHPAG